MMEEAVFWDGYSHPDNLKNLIYSEESFPGTGADCDAFNSVLDVQCECQDNCVAVCPCVQKIGPSYVDDLLSEEKLVNNRSVLECGESCCCSLKCNNRVVQRGPCRYLRIGDASKKGYGLFCTRNLKRGTFICEYAGEIIGKAEASVRSRDSIHRRYILLLREHCAGQVHETCVDATCVSNIGRYVNHSCSPNCMIVAVRVGTEVPRLCLFALRDLEEGEEVTYSYGSSESSLSSTICFCGEDVCRGYLPCDGEVLTFNKEKKNYEM